MKLVTWNVVRHLLIQIGAAAALGAIAALAKVDWSALGGYAPLVASLVGTIAAIATAAINEALGTAPKA